MRVRRNPHEIVGRGTTELTVTVGSAEAKGYRATVYVPRPTGGPEAINVVESHWYSTFAEAKRMAVGMRRRYLGR